MVVVAAASFAPAAAGHAYLIETDPQFGAFSRFTSTPPEGLFLGDYQQLAAGGNDETYVTRDEAFAPTPGATCNTGFLTPMTCQNQTTWVAHLLPASSPNIPDTRFIPAIVLVGGAVGILALRRRRRPTDLET